MKGNKIKGVVFDLDGTLIDSYQALYLSFHYVYIQMGLFPLSYEEVKKVVGRGLSQTFGELLGEERVSQALSLFQKKYEEVFRSHTHLLPQVRDVLENLHGRGVHLSVATNKFGHFSRAILEHLGMDHLFVVILGDGDLPQNKPHPGMVYWAVEKMGVKKEDTIFVGDSVVDIQTAKNAGVKVYVVPTGNTPRKDLEKAQPTMMLDRFQDLLRFV